MPSCKCVLSTEVVRVGLEFLRPADVQVIKWQLFSLTLQRFNPDFRQNKVILCNNCCSSTSHCTSLICLHSFSYYFCCCSLDAVSQANTTTSKSFCPRITNVSCHTQLRRRYAFALLNLFVIAFFIYGISDYYRAVNGSWLELCIQPVLACSCFEAINCGADERNVVIILNLLCLCDLSRGRNEAYLG